MQDSVILKPGSCYVPAKRGRTWIMTLFFGPAISIAAVAGHAHAQHVDVLFAVMEDHRGEKSSHQQNLPGENCDRLLSAYRQSRIDNRRMQLTFSDPPFSGYVVEIYCIRPDGSIRKP